MLALVGEVPKQPAVRLVGWAHLKQPVGPLAKLGDAQAELLGVDDIALIASASLRILRAACGTRACPGTESAISSPVRLSRCAAQV